MDAYLKVANKLQELGITFDVVEPPTCIYDEQADSYIEKAWKAFGLSPCF